MCWRGHDRRNKYGNCMDCHAIRMRARIHGRTSRRLFAWRLNVDAFRKHKRMCYQILGELAGVNGMVIRNSWVYLHNAVSEANARALAEAMSVPFDKLWVKA